MSSSVWISQENRTFQLRLIFGLLLFLLLAYTALTAAAELQLALFGSTARAAVVYVSNPYDSQGRHVTSPRVDYEYYDDPTHVIRRECYWAKANEPTPTLGQTLDIKYIPGKGFSEPTTRQSRISQYWPIIPAILLASLLALSFYNQNAKLR
jgi:uncharacterized integral membrane protein